MNNVLQIIQHRVPQPVLDNIHSYLRNDVMEKCLREYFLYLTHKRDLYRDFAYEQYVFPHCECRRHRDECRVCYLYDYSGYYEPNDYVICMQENPQYYKIITGSYSPYQHLYDLYDT